MSWPVSDAFLAALTAEAHTVVIRIDVLEGGRVIRSTDNIVLGAEQVSPDPLSVATGAVQVVARGDVRRSGSLEVTDATGALVPITSGDLLDPLAGREFRLWRGLVLFDGTHELVPVATLTIEEATIEETAEAITVSLSGRDRAAAVAENTWQGPFNVEAGFPATATALAVVVDRLPHLVVPSNLAPSAVTVEDMTLGVGNQLNPWADVQKIAEGAAMEAFFDPMGRFTMRPIADPTTTPVVRKHLLDGTGLRVVNEALSRRVNRSTLRNGVIVRGSAPWLLFPVEGQAWDTDRASNTYSGMLVDGVDFIPDPAAPSWARPRAEVIDDAQVSTTAQAKTVAVAKLNELRGIEEVIELATVIDPSLDAGDVIEVEAASLGGRALLPLDSLDVAFGVEDTQSLSAKRRRR